MPLSEEYSLSTVRDVVLEESYPPFHTELVLLTVPVVSEAEESLDLKLLFDAGHWLLSLIELNSYSRG